MREPRGETSAHFLCLTTSLNLCIRITEYENKIAELETETDRLSQALESHKAAAEDSQAITSKKVDELAREVQKRVFLLHDPLSTLNT